MSIAHIKNLSAASIAASVLLLTACSSNTGGSGVTPFALQPSLTTSPFGKSSKDLLYVADPGTNEVETFAWPHPKSALGTVVGPLSEPQGMCADQSGDAFVANTGGQNILEFNGAKLTNTLSDAHQYPVGCSYNTSNGDLAAANLISTADGAGSVAIYKDATGTPTIIGGGSVLQRFYAIAYDGSGNLFASGETSSYGVAFAELRAGSKKFKAVCTHGFSGGGTIAFPGGLAWDGRYLVIGNQNGGVVYRVDVKTCTVIGTTTLGGSSDVVNFTIAGKFLVAPDAGNASVEIYKYPQGGNPEQTLIGFSEPIGAAVSQTSKRK